MMLMAFYSLTMVVVGRNDQKTATNLLTLALLSL